MQFSYNGTNSYYSIACSLVLSKPQLLVFVRDLLLGLNLFWDHSYH